MNILHYSLGFPPFRTGGMTKYCMNLMETQIKQGNKVGLLWPGKLSKGDTLLHIEERRKYHNNSLNITIDSYELKNAMPVPLLDGIKNVEIFTSERNNSEVIEWFKRNQIEIIHIHTLMGLPKEFLDAAKLCGVKLIFTSHDYFGLCPKCSFMNGIRACTDNKECIECPKCNETALSINKIMFMQSTIYKYIKELKIVKLLRKRHIKSVNDAYKNKVENIKKYTSEEINQYIKLREYYIKMFLKIDIIHFNSTNTLKVYKRYLDINSKGKVISISHSNINNHKKRKEFSDKVSFSYLGPVSVRKGFFDLKGVLDNLYNEGLTNFKLNIYSTIDDKIPYLSQNKPYSYNQLETIMNNTDVLIVPSIWSETFGFTVLEALSYGVPVIVSSNVGAKDLLDKYKSGIIYDNIDELEKELRKILLNPKEILSKINQYIVSNVEIKDINKHNEEIMNLYKNI